MALIGAVENGKYVETTSSEDTKPANNNLGYDQFLQLLCAEMQYQDPLEPTSNTEYVAQLATFSQMEATLNMQNTMLNNNANGLVGQYVIVKSTSSVTGETSAAAGYVDYVQYENNTPYLYINGSRYSINEVFQVADAEYMEASTLADAFKNSVKNLPEAKDLTAIWREDVENLVKIYDNFNAYQKSMIDDETMEKFEAIVVKMSQIIGESNGGTQEDGATEGTVDTV